MNKVDITPAKLAELKKKAEVCHQEIWKEDVYSVAYTVAACGFREDAEFIAAADPATVLAMVEEIEQFRRMERKWGQMLKNAKDTAPDLETFLSPDAFKLKESEAGQ